MRRALGRINRLRLGERSRAGVDGELILMKGDFKGVIFSC